MAKMVQQTHRKKGVHGLENFALRDNDGGGGGAKCFVNGERKARGKWRERSRPLPPAHLFRASVEIGWGKRESLVAHMFSLAYRKKNK